MLMANTAQEDFFVEYTRSKLVEWCAQECLTGKAGLEDPKLIQMALEKGWLTKRQPHTITAKGYGVAAAFLRR
ncbi:MAG: hypothetical protein EBY17_23345 [Acidobacteriia bacterium]|jgi:hypothetical protein|nr:hypothetical protein [Terriglobia bacterium]